jgi:hypothetical protein
MGLRYFKQFGLRVLAKAMIVGVAAIGNENEAMADGRGFGGL